MAHDAALDIAGLSLDGGTVVKNFDGAVVLVCNSVYLVRRSMCKAALFLTDPAQWCVDPVDCLVVLIRLGLWRSMRRQLRSLTQLNTAVGHAGSHRWSGVAQCTRLGANLAICQMTPPQKG